MEAAVVLCVVNKCSPSFMAVMLRCEAQTLPSLITAQPEH